MRISFLVTDNITAPDFAYNFYFNSPDVSEKTALDVANSFTLKYTSDYFAKINDLNKLFNDYISSSDGSTAVRYGNAFVKVYDTAGEKLFVKDLSRYPRNTIDGIVGLFAGALFLQGRQDVIGNLEQVTTGTNLTDEEVYVLGKLSSALKVLEPGNIDTAESALGKIGEIESRYKQEKILNARQFNSQYLLIESQRPTCASWFDLYDLVTGKVETLPTYPSNVSLLQIVSQNEFVFRADGTNSEDNYAGFPCIIRCIRGQDGAFKTVSEVVYLNVKESATFGAKPDEILSGLSVQKNDIRATFTPEPGKEQIFYADFVMIPPTRTENAPDKHQLIFEFSHSRIVNKFLKDPTIPAEDSAYVNSITLEQDGENCRIYLTLKDNAKQYTCNLQSTQPAGQDLPLPYVDIMFR